MDKKILKKLLQDILFDISMIELPPDSKELYNKCKSGAIKKLRDAIQKFDAAEQQ
jgi:phosphorylcholine metabolism protein LicD